jgi:hypothetical protein
MSSAPVYHANMDRDGLRDKPDWSSSKLKARKYRDLQRQEFKTSTIHIGPFRNHAIVTMVFPLPELAATLK